MPNKEVTPRTTQGMAPQGMQAGGKNKEESSSQFANKESQSSNKAGSNMDDDFDESENWDDEDDDFNVPTS
ncbi:hypothetical protein [Bdellovibrio reynosensis]|uniref:Uncharacterized protein n=1 Tax=Bdellovibrio reynosensis TaxID=2835041 RepID=A0ABY4CAA3_9BACT|nr:hypothetical protein [Bdellovibrio reynosensis]UOF01896.1 hypothetical protein MNR06_02870 [Bdellovibrio reynosensis]